MENKNDILKLIEEYEQQHTNEAERTADIKEFLSKFDDKELFDRKNFTGHITASAYIINPQRDSLLMLKHKHLHIWLQPGGHVDETDASLLDAAMREANEETGIALSNLTLFTTNVFDIDSHAIPAHEKKKEPPHIHHDISFLFLCNTSEINIDEEESTAGKWVKFDEISTDVDYEEVVKKIKSVI